MVVRKRKKILKKRGHRTAGYGSSKKHRGGGSRGGRGKAGLHKHKVSKMIKYMPEHFGKIGFKRPAAAVKEVKTINLRNLDAMIENWLKEGKARKENDGIRVNLFSLGYDKLLGSGKVSHKLFIEGNASKKAIRKIEEAGGQIISSSESLNNEKHEK